MNRARAEGSSWEWPRREELEADMPATTLRARSLTVSLTASDLEKSTRFYTEGLGFEVQEEWKDEGHLKGVMLDAGGGALGLSQDDFGKGRDRVKGTGMRLHIETDQDIEGIARRAKDAGIKLDSEPGPLPWGPIGFSVTDPDGFKLTISQPS